MKREAIWPGDPVFWERETQQGPELVPAVVSHKTPDLIGLTVQGRAGETLLRFAEAEKLTPGVGYMPMKPPRRFQPGEKRPIEFQGAGE